MGADSSCRVQKNCPSDYLCLGLTISTSVVIFAGVCFLWMKRQTPEVKAKQVKLLAVQAVGTILWLVSLLMLKYLARLSHYGQWATCYLWPVWVEGPFGYCLVVSCYVARAYRLYHVFVRRRLPPISSRHLVILLIVPILATAAVVQWKSPFKKRTDPFVYCSGSMYWWLFISAVHVAYIVILIISTWLVRGIRFEFNESKELLASIFASVMFLGAWLALMFVRYRRQSNRVNETFEITMSYILIFLGSMTALCFAFFPVVRPLKSYIHNIRKRKAAESMGQVLGVPNSGLLQPFSTFRFDEPLEVLLQHNRFRSAFQDFADSRFAGESVRFYFDVREMSKISSTSTTSRIYMAHHIIDTYVDIGSPMEINISYQMRSDILNTKDLSDPMLFERAAAEAINIMHLNLVQDFWQSPHFRTLKAEIESEVEFAEQLEWMNISSKRDSFSTTDNLFEYNGSPHALLKYRSPSPPNNEDFALPPSAALTPENLMLRVGNNGSNISLLAAHYRDVLDSPHHHPLSMKGIP